MKVAILITTINRPEFIKRTVTYYDYLNSQHPIYIGDASSVEISQRTLKFLEEINNVEVHYFHWERLGGIQTHFRLAKAASLKFEFCAYHGDDDYFIPSSLTRCAEFLSQNPDYRTAQGRAALVGMDGPEPVCNINSIGQYWGDNYLEESNRMSRLKAFHNNYYVMQFSLHRTHEFLDDSRDFKIINDGMLSELLHCYTFAIKGKSKFIDCLYLIRVRHPDLLLVDSGKFFFDWITGESWSHDYNMLLDSISRLLSKEGDITYSEAKKFTSNMMKEKLLFSALRTVKKTDKYKRKIYLNIKKITPDFLKKLIKLIKKKNDMELLRTKGSRFFADFLPVESSLTGKGSPDV